MKHSSKNVKKEGYLEEKHRFFHLRDSAGQERDFHFHEFDKIVILISGNVDYMVENNIYSLQPGDYLLVPHHTIHKAVIDKTVPYERIIFYLNGNYYSGLIPDAGISECFDSAYKSGGYLLRPDANQTAELSETLSRYENYSGGSLEAMRDALMVQLLIQIGCLSSNDSSVSYGKHNEKIETILSYINENSSEKLSVDELADMLYLSRYHFMRLFKESTGMSVHAYVTQRRLMNASRLIREGLPAAQAARQSGFDDYSVFYKAFKKNFGISPGDLKK